MDPFFFWVMESLGGYFFKVGIPLALFEGVSWNTWLSEVVNTFFFRTGRNHALKQNGYVGAYRDSFAPTIWR